MNKNLLYFLLRGALMILKSLAGSALGIGRECDGLGPMLIGGLELFLLAGVYIARTGFWGVYIVKYINRQTQNIDIED